MNSEKPIILAFEPFWATESFTNSGEKGKQRKRFSLGRVKLKYRFAFHLYLFGPDQRKKISFWKKGQFFRKNHIIVKKVTFLSPCFY